MELISHQKISISEIVSLLNFYRHGEPDWQRTVRIYSSKYFIPLCQNERKTCDVKMEKNLFHVGCIKF